MFTLLFSKKNYINIKSYRKIITKTLFEGYFIYINRLLNFRITIKQ